MDNIDLTPEPLDDKDKMPFGRFRDFRMEEVPAWYLIELVGHDWLEEKYPEVYEYIENNWDVLQTEL